MVFSQSRLKGDFEVLDFRSVDAFKKQLACLDFPLCHFLFDFNEFCFMVFYSVKNFVFSS